MKKTGITLLILLVGILSGISATGCSEAQRAPALTQPETELQQKIEFHGVTLYAPSEWSIIFPSKNENNYVRLVYPGDSPGTGPWIEFSQVLKPIEQVDAVSASGQVGGEILTFPRDAVSSDGSRVHYIYIPSKNVMVKAGCKGPAEYSMVTDILSTIQISEH